MQILRGHHGSALSHVQSGVNILTSINEADEKQDQAEIRSEESCVPREILDVLYMRLDSQMFHVWHLPFSKGKLAKCCLL